VLQQATDAHPRVRQLLRLRHVADRAARERAIDACVVPVHAHVTEVGGYSCYTQCSGTNFTDWYSCVGGCSDSGCNGRPCQTE
jgi:hypothetical protein